MLSFYNCIKEKCTLAQIKTGEGVAYKGKELYMNGLIESRRQDVQSAQGSLPFRMRAMLLLMIHDNCQLPF